MTTKRYTIGVFILLFVITGLFVFVSPSGKRAMERLRFGPQRDILTYVPADTVFFFGGLEPAPALHMIEAFAPEYAFLKEIDWMAIADNQQRLMGRESPGARMFSGLGLEYMRVLTQGAQGFRRLGFGAQIKSAIYAVGIVPVVRFKLEDPRAFTAFVKRAETAAMVSVCRTSTVSGDRPGLRVLL